MCFVGKSEGSAKAKASSRKASSRKAPSRDRDRERDWVGVSGSLPL